MMSSLQHEVKELREQNEQQALCHEERERWFKQNLDIMRDEISELKQIAGTVGEGSPRDQR